jgi:hypothetical protein
MPRPRRNYPHSQVCIVHFLKELPYGFVSQRIAVSGDRSIRGDDVQLI